MAIPLVADHGSRVDSSKDAGSVSSTHGILTRVEEHYLGRLAPLTAEDPSLSLHFGYWARGLNPLSLTPMVDRMTSEAVDLLELDPARSQTLLDVASGRGRPARVAAERLPRLRVFGVDLLAAHVVASARTADPATARGGGDPGAAVTPQPRFLVADDRCLPFSSSSFDAAMVLEALCHAGEPGARAVLAEIARVLAPGAGVVFAEPFRRKVNERNSERRGRTAPSATETWVCRSLAIEPLIPVAEFCQWLEREGLGVVECREITWRLAPSAALLQWRLALLAMRQLGRVRGGRSAGRTLLGVVGASTIGLTRRHGYYLIRARKI